MPSPRSLTRRATLRTGAALLLTASAGATGSAAASAVTAPAPHPRQQSYAGYLFAYFTGEGTADGEQVYFALSQGNDPLRWRELNGGRPVLTSTLGEGGVRDPFLIRSPHGDRFYLLATDLRIHGNGDWDGAQRHGSRSIMIWESTDLVTWSEQRAVEVSPPAAGNTWAPEAYWDAENQTYVVFWASKLYAEDDPDHTGDSHQRMMYATTRDFVTFSEARVWHDPGHSVIDSTVIAHDGFYYRFTKDERDASADNPCGKFIVQERARSLLADSWELVAECVGSPALERGEGPTVFASNTEEKWYLFIDEFGGRGYVPFETTDLASGQWTVPAEYQLPASPRHGTVIPLTRDEYERLAEHWPAAARGNPVLPGYHADPNIAVFGDTYYLYPTTDGHPDWSGTTFSVWSSPDLVHWRDHGVALDLGPGVSWADARAWAPAIAERDGRYYFYFCAEAMIGVATGDSPTGPFTDTGAPLIEANPDGSGQAIDPAVFTDRDGQSYLYWGNGSAWVVPLNDDMVSFDPGRVIRIEGLTGFREGLFMVERQGIYHLTYSIDDTRSEDYRVGYATAASPTGPFTYQGVILRKDPARGILGTGHNSVLNVPGTDDWYLVYHRFAIPGGDGTHRETCVDRLTFGPDGLMRPVVPTLEGVGPHPVRRR
ncbi:family 43 glycosylhydrolase [Streptomyces sp. 7-21]|uniref:family 43 glycosylhydrolase n=1 Tax=Streptomyces sp. 7-21 TaxID=2802283 RepID=UPI00191CE595|nr:family 43 glycosylhydrolase [Streptomyces sp. 7-21]MBL1068782.1 family 43 glycosylhydrolase [Streptomyces sp. 7-21]